VADPGPALGPRAAGGVTGPRAAQRHRKWLAIAARFKFPQRLIEVFRNAPQPMIRPRVSRGRSGKFTVSIQAEAKSY
jgi:hypothetical protein